MGSFNRSTDSVDHLIVDTIFNEGKIIPSVKSKKLIQLIGVSCASKKTLHLSKGICRTVSWRRWLQQVCRVRPSLRHCIDLSSVRYLATTVGKLGEARPQSDAPRLANRTFVLTETNPMANDSYAPYVCAGAPTNSKQVPVHNVRDPPVKGIEPACCPSARGVLDDPRSKLCAHELHQC